MRDWGHICLCICLCMYVYASGCKTVRVVTHIFNISQFHIMFLSLHIMLHSYVHVTGNTGWAGVG